MQQTGCSFLVSCCSTSRTTRWCWSTSKSPPTSDRSWSFSKAFLLYYSPLFIYLLLLFIFFFVFRFIFVFLFPDKYKIIQFESFHVFKVFVANPKKPQQIIDILIKNKKKLITFLTNFHNQRSFYCYYYYYFSFL
jgi:hypothetical protein